MKGGYWAGKSNIYTLPPSTAADDTEVATIDKPIM